MHMWSKFQEKWKTLLEEFGEGGVLVVSNTAGAAGDENQVCAQFSFANPRREYWRGHWGSESSGIQQKYPVVWLC